MEPYAVIRHDGKVRIAPANFAQQFEAVAVGQADVEQQQVERLFVQRAPGRLRPVSAHGHRIAFGVQQEFEALADFGFVVDDQDRALRHEPLSLPPGIPVGTMCPCPASSARQFCPHVP